jgi:hypothetical protein
MEDPGVGDVGQRRGHPPRRLGLLHPTTLLVLDHRKARQIASAIAEVFPVPAEFLAEAVRVIMGEGTAPSVQGRTAPSGAPTLEPGTPGWRDARASMARTILDRGAFW